MFTNPYERLVKTAEASQFEEVEGQLACQKCGKVASEGRYYNSDSILIWNCPDGHYNELKDYVI